MKIYRQVTLLAMSFFLAVSVGWWTHQAHGQGVPFNDISNSYAKDAIQSLADKGIMVGTSSTTFSPAAPVTRAEMATDLQRLLKLDPVDSPVATFQDVPKSASYYGSVQAAVQLDLVQGASATAFNPESNITRQEAAVLLVRAFKQEPIPGAAGYTDEGDIAVWAIGSVNKAKQLGWLQGDNNGDFRPKAIITREEMASILQRAMKTDTVAASLGRTPDSGIQLGWQYNQTAAQYETSVLEAGINTLSPRWYFIGQRGTVTDNTDTSLLNWAAGHNRNIWAMVGNRSDSTLSSQVLGNSSYRTALAANLAAVVKKYHLAGLNIDFENMAGKDQTNFSLFITDLAKRLHALNAKLSVDVSPDLGTDWTAVFDYQTLGESADYILLMGYDENWDGTGIAGSVASLPWVESSMQTLLSKVSPNKVILSLPLYNRDWSIQADGRAFSVDDISLQEQNILMQIYGTQPIWNPVLGQYEFEYMQYGTKHRIWLEEGRSLTQKMNIALKYKVAGVAYWYTGGGSSDVWTSVRNVIRYQGYSFK